MKLESRYLAKKRKNITVLFSILLLFATTIAAQDIHSEELILKNREIVLPGTISYPKSTKKVPLVIFVHGSGNVDRNGNQAGSMVKANYIKTLADSLNSKNIAVYRYDKRTATPENLTRSSKITITDFVKDVQVAIENFKTDGRFNGIHLIGHSQGSLVAMLAINNEIKSYISIAGPGESIDNTIIAQLKKQNEALSEVAAAHFEELKSKDTITTINPFLMSLFAPKIQRFIAHWMSLNPANELAKTKLPALILQGDADLQVTIEDAETLKKAQPNAILHIIPKMNHVLKQVNSLAENNKSYADENFPLSKKLVEHLTSFILSNQ